MFGLFRNKKLALVKIIGTDKLPIILSVILRLKVNDRRWRGGGFVLWFLQGA